MTARTAIASLLALALPLGTAWAGMETISKTVDAEGADRLEVNLDFSAGEITIEGGVIDAAAELELEINTRRVDYDIDYNVRSGTGRLYLESITRRSRDMDSDDNVWGITLSRKLPTSLEIDVGACDAELQLGGIPLEEVSLDIGAASGLITFDDPNPIRLRRFDIDAGAASLDCENLGNANFEEFSFSGGAGSFELDLLGEYDGESSVTIDLGLGSADLILPEGVACRVETDDEGWLSSVDLHGGDLDKVESGVWESDDFESSATRIFIDIDVGMGSVDIYFR